MAPNIQHNIHPLSAGPPRSAIIAGINVKVAPAIGKDYQRSIPVADSATDWLWETPPQDLFSAEHIVATVVRSAIAPRVAKPLCQHTIILLVHPPLPILVPLLKQSGRCCCFFVDDHSRVSRSYSTRRSAMSCLSFQELDSLLE
jgi:hypothetical protein